MKFAVRITCISDNDVALFARAWIEILTSNSKNSRGEVALFARAWIEIFDAVQLCFILLSRPLREGVD